MILNDEQSESIKDIETYREAMREALTALESSYRLARQALKDEHSPKVVMAVQRADRRGVPKTQIAKALGTTARGTVYAILKFGQMP